MSELDQALEILTLATAQVNGLTDRLTRTHDCFASKVGELRDQVTKARAELKSAQRELVGCRETHDRELKRIWRELKATRRARFIKTMLVIAVCLTAATVCIEGLPRLIELLPRLLRLFMH